MKRAIIIAAAAILLASTIWSGAQMFAQLFAATSTARLPAEYQEVEYLESSGTQYIDTGYFGNQNTEIFCKWMTFDNENYGVYGAWAATNSIAVRKNTANPGVWFRFNNLLTTPAFITTATNTIITSVQNKTGVTYDGVSVGVYDDSVAFVMTAQIRVFASTFGLRGRIFEFKARENNNVMRWYIPARRRADGVLGMYDLANNTFETNDGTGSFTAGPDVD